MGLLAFALANSFITGTKIEFGVSLFISSNNSSFLFYLRLGEGSWSNSRFERCVYESRVDCRVVRMKEMVDEVFEIVRADFKGESYPEGEMYESMCVAIRFGVYFSFGLAQSSFRFHLSLGSNFFVRKEIEWLGRVEFRCNLSKNCERNCLEIGFRDGYHARPSEFKRKRKLDRGLDLDTWEELERERGPYREFSS